MQSMAKAARKKSVKSNRVTRGSIDKLKRQIPGRLAQVRGERSQRSFARELGVFQQNVNRYENGTTPHADFLITLAIRENISLDWLILGRGRPRLRS
jgi:transcriptional regulator with XRE-family HTH domain